ncbi:hypothetical protein EDD18DRAFT_1355835 [Armillaria luteobubalina]|uniref:C2H2-type domain-containing protein n=1 Tax=Armillaria luteobubalina TaxID=153913 RepID=A0AA39Q0D7_9AGAR|nr:hypothetical protein EDD18DRAFT_1355835 [Armillaria luteobubalina]
MALFTRESQYLPPTEDYNSLYELAPFSFGNSDTLTDNVDFFPDHVLGLDQNGFWPGGNYQTELIQTPDTDPTYGAIVPLILQTQSATTPVDVATVLPAPSEESDAAAQPTDACDDEGADYDLHHDFVDFATESLPCESPVSLAPPSPLTPLPEINDEDSYAEEPVYEESEYEEPESLLGCRKRGRASDLTKITIYRTDVAQSGRRSGGFRDSIERYTFHDDPQHVRCMNLECQEEFNSVNAAIDHMECAHPKKEPNEAKNSKTTKKSKVAKKPKAVNKSRAAKQSKTKQESTVVRCIYFGCDQVQKKATDMRRHLLTLDHQPPRFRCGDCKGLFQRPDPVKRHQETFGGTCKGVYAENQPVRNKGARKS